MHKRILLIAILSATISTVVKADNTTTTVTQVTETVELTDDVDYHISSATPFTSTGCVDIKNTEHAVVILDSLKPSAALKVLSGIKINGAAAANNTNCQVKIFNRGSIILPYGNSIKPLTVFSEKGLKGDSCNSFGLESTGGYMNTLTEEKLNNRIQSFRLKRGYMVTFSTSPQGYGYSRCFIAAYADIEMDLPAVMANKVSSYRVFKWYDTSKAGLANDTRSESNDMLNTTWCYSFGLGESRAPDAECVPHHIYEDWPSSSACGGVTYSPNMKTNNEPGNSSDDHPQSVATVLANWQNLMRTGMRLCSPSSHDGSLSWMQEFMDSIDARGWRCDIVDLHCYWTEGQFNNIQGSFYNKYKRPIWISEFVWGASWNRNGVFASSDPYNENRTVMGRILDRLNSWDYIERYAYWNSENDISKIYLNGSLTKLGEYYANMNTGTGYKKEYDYVPRPPRIRPAYDLDYNFYPKSMTCKLSWSDDNGEFNDYVYLERKRNDGEWETIADITPSETSTNYVYTDTIKTYGTYTYRIHTISYLNKDMYSAEVTNVIDSSQGDGQIQWGSISTDNTDDIYTFYVEPFDTVPAMVFGSHIGLTKDVKPVAHYSGATKLNNKYSYFVFNYFPWTLSGYQTLTSAETTNYIAAQRGNGSIGSLNYEAGTITGDDGRDVRVKNDTTEVKFNKPFAATPVVMVTPRYTSSDYPYMWRVWDVTPEGFKVILQRQKGLDEQLSGFLGQRMEYFAIDRGSTTYGDKKFTVGSQEVKFTSTTASKAIEYGDSLPNPMPLIQMQSFNRKVAAMLHVYKLKFEPTGCRIYMITDTSDVDNYAVSSKNAMTEEIGFIVIGDNVSESGISRVVNDDISALIDEKTKWIMVCTVDGRTVKKVHLNGNKDFDTSELPKGVYILRTNNNKSAKIIKI